MAVWAYEMSNEVLLQEFARACAQSGLSHSGFAVDPMALAYAGEVKYLKGVLLARLDHEKPRFMPGDVIQSRSGPLVPVLAFHPHISVSVIGPQKVHKVVYAGNGKWRLEFVGVSVVRGAGTPQFPAEQFTTVPSSL